MGKSISSRIAKVVTGLVLLIGAVIILFPMYITIITSLKTQQESAADFFSLPSSFYLGNFISVFEKSGYWTYVWNSAKITIISVVLILVFIPMCAYAIARKMEENKYFKTIYFYLLLGIFVPFQVIMVPLVQYLTKMKLLNQTGLICMCLSLASSQGVFLLANYVKSVPRDLEEAASIDGCTTFSAYWRVVRPLIKPMVATIFVMNALWVWNDFQMPLLILNQQPGMWTLPLFQYNFKSQYTFDYNLAFASYLVAMLPVIIAYICAQKYIVAGLTQGAVKT